MEAYALDLRQRAVDAGQLRRPQIAVSTSWIRRLVQCRRETGSIAPSPSVTVRRPPWVRGSAGGWPTWSAATRMPPWPSYVSGWPPAWTPPPSGGSCPSWA